MEHYNFLKFIFIFTFFTNSIFLLFICHCEHSSAFNPVGAVGCHKWHKGSCEGAVPCLLFIWVYLIYLSLGYMDSKCNQMWWLVLTYCPLSRSGRSELCLKTDNQLSLLHPLLWTSCALWVMCHQTCHESQFWSYHLYQSEHHQVPTRQSVFLQ